MLGHFLKCQQCVTFIHRYNFFKRWDRKSCINIIYMKENTTYHLSGKPLYSNQIVSTPGGSVLLKCGLSRGSNKGKYPIRGAKTWNHKISQHKQLRKINVERKKQFPQFRTSWMRLRTLFPIQLFHLHSKVTFNMVYNITGSFFVSLISLFCM